MNRQDILEFINEIILEEHGNVVTEDDLLTASEIDSFGYLEFWLSINHKYDVELKEIDANVNYKTLTVKQVIDFVITKDASVIAG